MISLIPYIRETLRRHLNPKQAVMLVEFDKLKRDYQEHQNEIHSKLVAIMSDRLQVHCKTLQVSHRPSQICPVLTARPQSIDWEIIVVGRAEELPNLYMENLVKEHVTLHKVLSRFLSSATVEFIMLQVVVALNQRLVEEFGNVVIKSEDARERLRKDAMYLKTKLDELKGLEKGSPGEVRRALYFECRGLTLGSTGTGGTDRSETAAASRSNTHPSSDADVRASLI